jgi:hypothetical protein
LAKRVFLPKVNTAAGQLRPEINAMDVGARPGGLGINVVSRTPVNKHASIVVNMNMNMPLFVDKNGKVGLRVDKHPRVHHDVVGHGFLGGIVKLIVHIILGVTGTNIGHLATQLSHKFQAINVPATTPVSWTGARPFFTTRAKSQECLWFCDERPV